MNNELFDALEMLEADNKISADAIVEAIKNAICIAVEKYYNVDSENVYIELEREKRKFKVSLIKDVVDEVYDPSTEILLEEALEKNKRAKIGGKLMIKLDTKQIGRIAAQSGKNLIHSAIVEATKDANAQEFQSKMNQVISVKVERIDTRTQNATVEFTKCEAPLFRSEQLPTEVLRENQYVKVFVYETLRPDRRALFKLSRVHKDLVPALFEIEVPEIADGVVKIHAVAREPGFRTKISVSSTDENVDAVGSCIGHNNSRVTRVIKELQGEKIDIIPHSDDDAQLIKSALLPAEVLEVKILDTNEVKSCQVIVPNSQLSLAIGNKGQNAKLAARITGYKIDICPEIPIPTDEPTE